MSEASRLNLTVVLERGSGRAAARESLQRMTESEWSLLVEYALAVVVLQESRATEMEYWVAPRSRE